LTLLIITIGVALLFDFTNGFHDTANAVATSISTRALSPRIAVLIASVANLFGAFVTTAVAATVGSGIIDTNLATQQTVLAAVTGAIIWNLTTWWFGLPSSSSHALIGGLIGAAVAKVGFSSLIAEGIVKTVAFIFLSPILGFILGGLMLVMISWILQGRVSPMRADRWFRRIQLVSSSLYSLGHGCCSLPRTCRARRRRCRRG